MAAILRLQKPSRIFVEKPLEEILRENKKSLSTIISNQLQPGDRDDNLWMTANDYKPPLTQTEWEQTCFLGKTFQGYYTWPKVIKYAMNKRTRYTKDNMSEQVAIVYDRFIDKDFVKHLTKVMIVDGHTDDANFNVYRFTLFKVT